MGIKIGYKYRFFTQKLEKSKKADFPYMENKIFRKNAKFLAKYLAFFASVVWALHKQINTIVHCSLRLGEKPLDCGNLPRGFMPKLHWRKETLNISLNTKH